MNTHLDKSKERGMLFAELDESRLERALTKVFGADEGYYRCPLLQMARTVAEVYARDRSPDLVVVDTYSFAFLIERIAIAAFREESGEPITQKSFRQNALGLGAAGEVWFMFSWQGTWHVIGRPQNYAQISFQPSFEETQLDDNWVQTHGLLRQDPVATSQAVQPGDTLCTSRHGSHIQAVSIGFPGGGHVQSTLWETHANSAHDYGLRLHIVPSRSGIGGRNWTEPLELSTIRTLAAHLSKERNLKLKLLGEPDKHSKVDCYIQWEDGVLEKFQVTTTEHREVLELMKGREPVNKCLKKEELLESAYQALRKKRVKWEAGVQLVLDAGFCMQPFQPYLDEVKRIYADLQMPYERAWIVFRISHRVERIDQ